MQVVPWSTHQLPRLRTFLARAFTNRPLSRSPCTMIEDTSCAAIFLLANLSQALATLPVMLSANLTVEVHSLTPHNPRSSRNLVDERVNQHKVERLLILANLPQSLEPVSQRLRGTLSSPSTL